jgi:hypothetical protein
MVAATIEATVEVVEVLMEEELQEIFKDCFIVLMAGFDFNKKRNVAFKLK